ncbi:MAG TPA: enoyl-CoA hydratase-related protein [Vicinamibacterales bacterium]|nr:enoyl-CoA hydratase-related protein [Vicinamibacterales bacterium]
MPAVREWGAVGLQFDRRDGIAWLTLNRPERRNAITPDLRRALIAAIAEVRDDPEIRAAVVTGSGAAFCSGADLACDWAEIPVARQRGTMANVAREDGRRYGWWRLIRDVWENEKPFVAAVNGPAYGFGCNFALACDIVVAAESAQFCEVFVKRGLPVEAGGAYLMTRYLSPALAKEMTLLGEPLSGTRAAEIGLANRCVADDQLLDVAADFATRLALLPTIGVGHIKGQINDAYESTFEQAWKNEVTLTGVGIGSDSEEAAAAFTERREPRFTGR